MGAAPPPPALGNLGSLFDSQAETYATYRLAYPPTVFSAIYDFAPEAGRQLAVDVGCGTGQVAVGLAEEFTAVVALDPSAGQIRNAAQRSNITYRQAPAEATGVEAGSADLVTAAQSLHWFDVRAFYRECQRILKPTGALAVWGYMPTAIRFPGSTAASEVLRDLLVESNPHFHPNRQRFLLRHYEGWEPTAEEFGVVESRVLDMERQMSVDQLFVWVNSMSGWGSYEEAHPGAGDRLRYHLLAALGLPSAGTPVTSVWPLTMVLAKRPMPL